MIYEVKGTIQGKPHTVTYEKRLILPARLKGSVLAIKLAEIKAAASIDVGPVGCYLKPDLNDPLAALFILRAVFDEEGFTATGEIPEAPGVPEGATI
jgi:hypothetical protein